MAAEHKKNAQEIVERVERERGFTRLWPKLLAGRDPQYLECLHNVAAHVLFERHALPRKTKEIILSCLNAYSLYEFGFRIHVRSALQAGATEDELLEALETVGIGNLHGMTSMLPVLVEEIQKFQSSRDPGNP